MPAAGEQPLHVGQVVARRHPRAQHAHRHRQIRERPLQHRRFGRRIGAVGGLEHHGEAAVQGVQQPAPRTAAGDRCVHRRAARPHGRREGVDLGRVQRRAVVDGRSRQPAAVDETPGEFVVRGELEGGVAQRHRSRPLRGDEVGGAGGVEDVLVRREAPLEVVRVEQRLGSGALQHQSELPGEVVGVLDAAVAAARAEGRDLVGRIAGEDHPAVAKALEPPALEGVDRDPLELEGPLAQHGAQPRHHPLGPALLFRIGLRAELQVDAPDVVGLLVQERRLTRVEGRLEPEPALGRVIGLHVDIGDEEAVLEHPADEGQAQKPPDRTLGAVAGHQPLRVDAVRPLRALQLDQHAVVARLHAHHPRAPADLDVGLLLRRLDAVLFEVVLLEVDEGGHAVARLGQQVEAPDLAIAEEHPPGVPGHALVQKALADAEPVHDLEGVLGPADGARADGDGVVVVHQQHPAAALREVEGEGETDGAGAHHHRLVLGRLRPGGVRGRTVGEPGIDVGAHGFPPALAVSFPPAPSLGRWGGGFN
ncbi:hypothetical protein HRbin39_01830 [bacterium HR39]|nr:hypothetical protein HRbin39_01830 [bacterium HR39]